MVCIHGDFQGQAEVREQGKHEGAVVGRAGGEGRSRH